MKRTVHLCRIDHHHVVQCKFIIVKQEKSKIYICSLMVEQEEGGGANSDFIGFAGLPLGKLWESCGAKNP